MLDFPSHSIVFIADRIKTVPQISRYIYATFWACLFQISFDCSRLSLPSVTQNCEISNPYQIDIYYRWCQENFSLFVYLVPFVFLIRLLIFVFLLFCFLWLHLNVNQIPPQYSEAHACQSRLKKTIFLYIFPL